MENSDVIIFHDVANNKVYARKDAITVVVCKSPLNPEPKAMSMVMMGGVTSQVQDHVANQVLKDLGWKSMIEDKPRLVQ